MPKYKLLKAYDAGEDLSKEWFVKYQYLKPEHLRKPGEPIYQRFKVGKGINSLHTVKDRKDRLKVVLAGMKLLLDQYDFDPFKVFSFENSVDHPGYSLTECIDKYIEVISEDPDEKDEQSKKTGLSPDTIRKYKERLNLFNEWLKSNGRDNAMIYEITKTDIITFLEEKKALKKWSNKTRNHFLTDIRTFFNFYKKNREGYIEKNPADYIKKLRVLKKGNLPFTSEILKKVIEHTKEKDYKLYLFQKFLYYSCCRPDSEARFIRREYFDLVGMRLMVPAEISKNGVTQYIPIDDEFFKFLTEELEIQNMELSWYIFGKGYQPNTTPIYKKAYSRRFLAIKRLLKLHKDHQLYSFKHTRACHLVEDGVPLHRIQDVTRHLTLDALMDYLKDLNLVIEKRDPIKSRAL